MAAYTEKQLLDHYFRLSEKSKRQVTKIIGNLCTIERVEARSTREAEYIMKTEWTPEQIAEAKDDIRCTFCGKPRMLSNRMIAGNGAYICDECVNMCKVIIDDPDALRK